MAKKTNADAMKYLKRMGGNASIVSEGTINDNNGKYIDSGNFLMNAQINGSIYSGLYSNKILALAGEESSGKTFVLLGIIKNYLEQDPDNLVLFFESEGAVNKDTLETRNIDSTRVILKPVTSVENFKKESAKFLKQYLDDDPEERPKFLMCLDSLGMLPSDKEVNDAVEGADKSDMTRSKTIKSIFRILTVNLAEANIPFIFTNHVYATMDMYGKPVMSGGSGLKYSAYNILELMKSNYKEKDGAQTTTGGEHNGISVTCNNAKSRDTIQNRKIKFVIHAKHGLSRYSGMFQFCYDNELISKKGTRYYWNSKGEESQLYYKKEIEKEPELFFTKDILKEIDKFCIGYFSYGNPELEKIKEKSPSVPKKTKKETSK